MRYTSYDFTACRMEVAAFEVEGGRSEYHLMGHVTDNSLNFLEQTKRLAEAYTDVRKKMLGAVPVFERYFLSDAANQKEILSEWLPSASQATSFIEQPPLDGSRIALWAYLQTGVETRCINACTTEVSHGGYQQLWSAHYVTDSDAAYQQTLALLNRYSQDLNGEGLTLANDCLRTWIFVRDVDRDYKDMVKARNKFFAEQGLTKDTHFIASTGIGGKGVEGGQLVTLDAFAVKGLKPEQVRFICASSHMSRTSDYGVSFERGTAVDFDGRRLVIVSGTASIDNKGEVMYLGDVEAQTKRMWENVEALLTEAEVGFEDVGYMIVYLRNMADYPVVKRMFDEHFPQIPHVLTLAPVCRPSWLVEMECMAVKRL